jgi:hypothetical protein
MVIAADYPLLEVFWTILIFFAWVAWIWTAVAILSDVFSRRDISGWGKAAWTVVLIAVPFLGVLTYLVLHSTDMAERNADRAQANRAQFDDYVRSVSNGDGAATEIAKAEQLLKSGAIDDGEFAAIKAKALA